MKSTSQRLQNRKVLNPVEEPRWRSRLARFHKRCLTVKLLQLRDDLQLRLGLTQVPDQTLGANLRLLGQSFM